MNTTETKLRLTVFHIIKAAGDTPEITATWVANKAMETAGIKRERNEVAYGQAQADFRKIAADMLRDMFGAPLIIAPH